MLSELQLSHRTLLDLVSIVLSALNNSLSYHRGYYAPLTVFTGLQPTTPIRTFTRSDNEKFVTVPDITSSRCLSIDEPQQQVNTLHSVFAITLEENRERSQDAVKRGQLATFSYGDFVLIAQGTFCSGKKLCLR